MESQCGSAFCFLIGENGFWVVGMLCMSLSWNGVQAEDSMKGQPAPILEMGVKPKATPQELEQMRWMEIFANDIALYRFDVQSIRQNETDPNEVRMTVQAIYTDKKILNQMKTDYASRLKDDRMPVCSEMELRFHMKEERYAITAVRIYDQNHEVVDQRSREAEYRKIPVNSFVSTMYRVSKKYIWFQKTKGK